MHLDIPDLDISDFSTSDFDLEPVDQQFLFELLTEYEAQLGPNFVASLDAEHPGGGRIKYIYACCFYAYN